jgi:predicted transcriptional regulator
MGAIRQTTIQISKVTRKRLDKLKLFEREPLDSVIERLTNMAVDEEPLSESDITGIKKGLKDIEEGKVYTLESVKKGLGIK